jgi:hypothetical protein
MRDNSGPPCPKPVRVRELVDIIGDEKTLTTKDSNDIIDALDWLATMLENRALYHKKQNIKNRVLRTMARDLGLDDEVGIATEQALHTHVGEQKPDRDFLDVDLSGIQGDGREK